MTTTFWTTLLADYEQSGDEWEPQGKVIRDYVIRLRSAVRQRLGRHPEDVAFLAQALREERTSNTVARLFREMQWMPDALYEPMIRAAVANIMESCFVDACVAAFGHRRVFDTLLGIFEDGDNRDKVGAAHSLYWAGPGLVFEGGGNFELGIATPESRATLDALTDVLARKDRLFLREFVDNTATDVQAAVISQLNLRASDYEPDLQPLVDEAVRIARNHPHLYIRERLEIQLRNA